MATSHSNAPLRADIWKSIGLLLLAAFVGLLVGHILLTMLICSIGIIAWQIHRLRLLVKWLENPRKNQIWDGDGQLHQVHGLMHRRMTQNRKRKKQISRYLNQFRKAVTALPDAIVLIDNQNRIEWANSSAQRLLDIMWPKDAGINIADLVRHPELGKALLAISKGSTGVEIPSPIDNKTIINVKVIRYTEEFRLIQVRDVSRLLRVNEMQKDFVANVSHELKTPLTVLSGYIEMIEDSPNLDEKLQRPVSQMAEHSKRMQAIVRDLLYLSKLENTPQQSENAVVNVTHLIQSIINSCKPLIDEKQHRLELEIDQQYQLIGSQDELQSAFSNLIINAINYTPPNGKIEVSWRLGQPGEPESQAVLSVKDNGTGIPHTHLERLTERFYRIDDNRSREKGGTGLGLSIVKNVLERHNAQLEIQSSPGAGSEFSCIFEAASIIKRAPIEVAPQIANS